MLPRCVSVSGSTAENDGSAIVCTLMLVVLPPLPLTPTTPLLTAQGRSLFPPRLLGRGLTLINIGSMGGVFAQQALTGLVIGLFEPMIVDGARIYPEIAYRAVFALLGVEMVLAMGAYAFFGRRFLENK